MGAEAWAVFGSALGVDIAILGLVIFIWFKLDDRVRKVEQKLANMEGRESSVVSTPQAIHIHLPHSERSEP